MIRTKSSSGIPRRRPSLTVGLLTPARLFLHRASQSLRDASFVLGINLEPTGLTLDRRIRFAVSQIDREDRFFNRALMRHATARDQCVAVTLNRHFNL